MKKLDLVGDIYGRLTVIEEVDPIIGKDLRPRRAWKCKYSCDKANIIVVKMDDLRNGDTKSCGCWNDEKRSERAKKMYSRITKYTPIIASARKVWKGRYKEMPFEDFYELSQQECYYCNEPMSNYQNAAAGKNSSQHMKDNGYFKYNGLDRVDSNLPHSRENCVPCCKWCNFAKRERSITAFKNWAIRLYEHFIENK